MKEYWAHTDGTHKQELKEHLENVSKLASQYATKFDAKHMGSVLGLLHDIGKYSNAFQQRLIKQTHIVDHSTAGAQVASQKYKCGLPISYCIAGHHGGLSDWIDENDNSGLYFRLEKSIPPYDAYDSEINFPVNLDLPLNMKAILKHRNSFFGYTVFIRMLFSCLIDADWEDTRKFYQGSTENTYPSLNTLQKKLKKYLDTLSTLQKNKINETRNQILQSAISAGTKRRGLFTFTVPTGGGKTLSSLAFALRHALHHNLDRIIYVIPFISITEQTAKIFQDILGNDSILEHHSSFQSINDEFYSGKDNLKLMKQRWDAPIIVTTAVQFFESLFSNRPSQCRKLHNIINSVVILDEAQTLPTHLLRPTVNMLEILTEYFGVTILLCTATQPALLESQNFKNGLKNVIEIIKNPMELASKMKRTKIISIGKIDYQQLVERLVHGVNHFAEIPNNTDGKSLNTHNQVLCIVNTRKHAYDLFCAVKTKLPNDVESIYHLSALMCSKHRKKILDEIRQDLKNSKDCIVISTSLVEAGVDLDFKTVYREINGLESIAQAAGRCNREGKYDVGFVYVFEIDKLHPHIQRLVSSSRDLLLNSSDPLSPDSLTKYFKKAYSSQEIGIDDLDKKQILDKTDHKRNSAALCFKTIAREYHIIDPMISIIIPYDNSAKLLLDKLLHAEKLGNIPIQLQSYTVQVHYSIHNKLMIHGAISAVASEQFGEQFWRLDNEELYDNKVGLMSTDPTWRDVEANLS